MSAGSSNSRNAVQHSVQGSQAVEIVGSGSRALLRPAKGNDGRFRGDQAIIEIHELRLPPDLCTPSLDDVGDNKVESCYALATTFSSDDTPQLMMMAF